MKTENDGAGARKPNCPQCGKPLEEVRYPSDSMLNRDQWESVRAGDWWCKSCPYNGRAKNLIGAYFWDSEVAERGEVGQGERNGERGVAAESEQNKAGNAEERSAVLATPPLSNERSPEARPEAGAVTPKLKCETCGGKIDRSLDYYDDHTEEWYHTGNRCELAASVAPPVEPVVTNSDREDWPEPLRSTPLADLTTDALIDWLGYCANKNLFWGSLREEIKRRVAPSVEEARSHLRVALSQTLPTDDQIIIGHIRSALEKLEEL
jgi:hypothetical protein